MRHPLATRQVLLIEQYGELLFVRIESEYTSARYRSYSPMDRIGAREQPIVRRTASDTVIRGTPWTAP